MGKGFAGLERRDDGGECRYRSVGGRAHGWEGKCVGGDAEWWGVAW